MNIYEAASSGLPFRHPGMLGAFVVVGANAGRYGGLIHRYNINDFSNMEWVKDNFWPDNEELFNLDVNDLLRTDWQTVIIDHTSKGVTIIRKM